MSEVNEITYLGDVICADGRNQKNIQNRTRKGTGLMCQIIKILHTVSFGSYTVEISLLLRNALFINGMLTNSEVWFGLRKSEIEQLERTDRTLLRKIFQVPSSIPAVALYLELGTMPLAVVIKVRRILYLHNILNSNRDGMLYKVFTVQWHYPSRDDWTLQVKSDLGLPVDLAVIHSFSKEKFKSTVKTKATSYTLNLLIQKKANYSKLRYLQYGEFEP